MPSLLFARDLVVRLGDRAVLTDVGFAVERGQFVGLLGPNGSGKTTLLRAVAGLVPYEGTLQLEGRAVHAWTGRALARRLAFVRQFQSLAFDFTVLDLLLLGRTPHKHFLAAYTPADRERADRALSQVDLEGLAGRAVTALSGGERQRVFLAQALVQEADLLLLDEPTAHLDVHYQYEFMALVRGLVAEGRTVVTVFHDLALAARFADVLLVLQNGRCAAFGPPRTVLTNALLADVYRMQGHVDWEVDPVSIRYLHPLTRPVSAPDDHGRVG